MVLIVFRSRLLAEQADEFHGLAERMLELAQQMPGFLSYRTYLSNDGERASLIEFESAEHLDAWRTHPEHAEAMRLGRERYYSEYTLLVADPVRESRFER
jgi:heme-degrading monooxygenase HmoA